MDRQNVSHSRRAVGSRVSSIPNRPQFYVHLDFGLSLSPGHIPNSHTVSYQSQSLRERLAHLPHKPPPTMSAMPTMPTMPATAARAVVPETQARRPAATAIHDVPRPSFSDHYYYQYQHNRGQTRRDARYDPPQQPQQPQAVWKPLPEVPGRFRLGETELPWSTGPDADPDDERLRPSSRAESDDGHSILHPFRSRSQEPPPVSASFSNIPTVLPLQSHVALELDPRRRQELESLSAAMVTVDNGFESQWWNQGGRDRLPVADVDGVPEQMSSAPRERTVSLGWAVASSSASASASAAAPTLGITRSVSDNVVSPWSASATLEIGQPSRQMTVSPMTVANEDFLFANPSPEPRSRLSRTLSTRSEELFPTRSRYA
ncbi:hypothetical protein CMQ_327 [Grosmannia clavigera kw1407]|uniref:Uncharacterized protein n=1 Tax=Grosmannia clavigera (strain kw1407 / UAMH 11150) TaxID=655863 RepID=F0XR86_GROCL|nr:uncharacterized protein CMQ_327 [Grosmannia clavigera kw1407]EFX00010.1 hypothetical protein CMQ_327 [Grosmannia clavigera kw1407]